LLQRFADAAFAPSRYEQPVQLRGVYFTSATQEGTPIDRVMGAISRSFGLKASAAPAAAGRGRSYFLTRLLREVVFAEAALAGIDLKGERRREVLKWASIAATALIVLGSIALWATSWSINRNLIDQLDQQVAETRVRLEDFNQGPADYDEISRLLSQVRALPTGYAERADDRPMLAGFGLWQGEKLGYVTQQAYVRLLHKMLLPQLIYRIEDRLRQNLDAQEFLYESLKTYLMLERPQRFDAEHVKSWYQFDLERFPPQMYDDVRYQALFEHVEALFDNLEVPVPYALDQDFIVEVRAVLRSVPLARRVVERLEIEADYAREIRPFRIDEAAGAQASVVFNRASGRALDDPLNGLYTYDGYQRLLKPELRNIALRLLNETWVIGDEDRSTMDAARELSVLINDVRALYFETFINKWRSLLADLEIAAFTGTEHAVQVLRSASGPQSPIRRLIAALRHETMLGRSPEGSAVGEAAAAAGERAARQRLSRLLPRELRGAARTAELPGSDREQVVEAQFEPLARLAGAPDSADEWPIDQSLSLVRRLAVTFEDSVRGGGSGLGTTSDLTRNLRENALMLPDPVSSWMQSLSAQVGRLSTDDRGAGLQRAWASGVLPVCRELTGQRFPFVPSAAAGLSIQEFGRVFGHAGLIDSFFQQSLRDRVDTSGSPWRWNSNDPIAASFSPNSLRMFEQARRIRDAFFPEGGQRMVLQLDFRPVEMDEAIDRLTLNIGDQTILYFHGPIRTTTIRWPDQSQRSEVRLQLDPPSAQGRSSYIQDGPWALLRFLDHFVQSPGATPDTVLVDMELGGRKARYQIRAHTLVNPLTSDLLQTFRCPSRL